MSSSLFHSTHLILHCRYWSLCTSSLSTPLLFSAGYRASLLQTTTSITERHDIQHQLSRRIITHLQNALQNVSRFSRSAADDIITAIRELAEHDCRELLPCNDYASDQCREISPSVGLLPALLLSYSSHPKLKATSRRFNESVSWKVAVTSAIEDIFKLAALTRKEGRGITDPQLYIDAAPSFTESFVQCSAGDLVVLYRVMDVELDSSCKLAKLRLTLHYSSILPLLFLLLLPHTFLSNLYLDHTLHK